MADRAERRADRNALVERAHEPRVRGGGVVALVAIVVLLAAYAAVSWLAVRGTVATTDEPLHVAAVCVNTIHLDFRADREDPPLWKYWAGIPQTIRPPELRLDSPEWRGMTKNPLTQLKWSGDVLYRTPGNEADTIVARSRAMMLVVAVALGAVIALWSWRLAGPVAAVVATAAFALDPNFIAHGPLIKNDVAFALGWVATALALWGLGRRVTWASVLLAELAVAATFLTKFSALLVVPLVAMVLIGRALLATPWPVGRGGRALEARGSRLLVVGGLFVGIGVFTCAATWASYGFRFSMTPQGGDELNWTALLSQVAENATIAEDPGRELTEEALLRWQPGPFVQGNIFLLKHRLMPEAWINGVLFTYATTLTRPNYLLGEHSKVGWWYYFPLAMLVKTPAATLVAIAGLVVVPMPLRRLRGQPTNDHASARPVTALSAWDLICLIVPPALYLLAAMRGNVNLGIRHVLCVYPFLFIGMGVVAARALRLWPRNGAVALAGLGTVLVLETALAFPHYIAFFNSFAGGPRGGLRLLSDSNLDWGQDLKLLAEWRRKNPEGVLYLSYFGHADPAYYGIEYLNLPFGYEMRPSIRFDQMSQPGYVAVSATRLQGIAMEGEIKTVYDRIRQSDPLEVLGGTIYIYRFSPTGAPPQ